MPGWKKQWRTALVKHLHYFHGSVAVVGVDYDTLEQLHESMHIDDYMCPPHSHDRSKQETPRDSDVGEVVLKYGDDYVQNLVKEIEGNGSNPE